MSTGTGENQGTTRADWRSSSQGSGRKGLRHRWQEERNDRPRGDRTRTKLVLVGVLLLASLAAMLGFFVWSVAFRPVRTPFVAIGAPAYGDPFPPNAWCREDLDRLAALHCETIDYTDLSTAWHSGKLGLRALDRELKNAAPTARRCGSTIVYLSMHGAVDGAGLPCLVPPGASPVDDGTWLPVPEVLQRLDKFGKLQSSTVLLVLDAGRIEVDWNLGALANEFAERLVELVDREAYSHVVVLNAAGVAEVAHASVELRGSVFGLHFHRGLAGAADEPGTGNEDGRVSVHELHDYLVREVDGWSRRNRGTTQRPLLLPADASDHVVAWGLGASRRWNLAATANEPPAPTATVTPAELNRLWSAYERVPSAVAERVDPIAWGAVRRLLRRVELTSVAGRDYAEAARHDYAELLLQLERAASTFVARELAGADADSSGTVRSPVSMPTVAQEWDLVAPASVPLPKALPAHTLALAERLGVVDRADGRSARAMLDAYYAGDQSWSVVKEQLSDLLGERSFGETEFPQLLTSGRVDRPWRLSNVVEVRRRAASLAAPEDERTLTWVGPAQDVADELRRRAEDRVLADEIVDHDWQAVAAAYDRVEGRRTAGERALACLDRAASRLPLYVVRLADPQRVAGLDDAALAAVVERLRDLTDDLHELHRLVRADATPPEAESLPFANLAAKVEGSLAALQADLTNEYTRLEGLVAELSAVESPSAEQLQGSTTALADVRRLLEVPLLPDGKPGSTGAARRGALRVAAEGLEWLVSETSGAIPLADLGDVNTVGEGFATRTATRWAVHPIEIVLASSDDRVANGPAGDAGGDTATLPKGETRIERGDETTKAMSVDGEIAWWRVGARIRERLRDVPDRVQRSTTGSSETVAELRALHVRGADVVRTAAPFWFPRPETDPVRRLRLFDLREVLMWNARRVVDDFWGPAGTESRSFFAAAASEYVDRIEEFALEAPALQEEVRQLRNRIERREAAARTGLALAAENVVVLDPAAGSDVTIVVTAQASAGQGGIPEGTATIAVQNDDGPIVRTMMTLPIPAIAADQPYRSVIAKHLGLGDLSGGRPRLVAELRYRGHRFAAPFLFEPVDGPSTEFAPRTFTTSTVRLSSGQRTPLSVVFVVDCSNSMREDSDLETVGSRISSKLDVARAALGNMLGELAPRENVEVGVVLFGHRAGWQPERVGLLHYNRRYARIDRMPPDLKPYEDVEVVLPPGRFDRATAAATMTLLATVDPWGESPLYLAVRRAAAALDNAEQGAERVVIVLTDGLNNQFAPAPAARVDLPDVLTALDGTGIRVHVVGFGISAAEKQRAQKEFERLGSFDVRPARATELLDSIRERLGPREYNVDGRSIPLGGEQRVDIPSARPVLAPVTFESRSTTLELWGGEFVDLELAATDGRPVTRPLLEDGVRVSLAHGLGDLGARGDDTSPPRTVVLHPPVREDDRVTFAFTFLRDDRAHSQRPRTVRFEITPIDARGRRSAARYVFADPAFVAGRSHPRLEYVAQRWPNEAVRAEVRGWVAFETPPPDETVAVTIGDPSAIGRVHRLASQPGASFSIATSKLEQGQLDVYERITGSGSQPGDLMFDLPSAGVTKIVRQFDDVHGIVTHTFLLEPAAARAGNVLELNVLAKSSLRRLAARMEPIEVDVVEPMDVVTPTVGPR